MQRVRRRLRIVYNVPIGERWFEVKLIHHQPSGHIIILVDSKETINQEQNFRYADRGKRLVLRIKKEENLFEYDLYIGGVLLNEYLEKCHRKFLVWELSSTGSFKTRVLLHIESSLLWWKGSKIGERKEGFRRDGPEEELKIRFEIEGRLGNIEVQSMNSFLFHVLKFNGVLYQNLEK